MITTRTRVAACAAISAALMSASAFANGTPPATPSTKPSTSSSSATSAATAKAGAIAAGVGIGHGGQGGAGGAGGSASVGPTSSTSAGGSAEQSQSQGLTNMSPSTSSINDLSSSTARSLSLFLPPPVFTPPMAKIDCASAHIKQSADAQLWSGFSQARAETDPTDCTLIQLRNAKVETCQYASAKQIEDLMVAKHLKGFKPNADVVFTDYSEKECAVLKAPRVEPPQAINFIAAEPPKAECKAEVVPMKRAKHRLAKRSCSKT